MSEAKSRIKSKEGLWASCYEFYLEGGRYEGPEWICADFLSKFKKAAKGAPEGSELARCAALLESLKLQSGADLILDPSAEQQAQIDKEVAKRSLLIDAKPMQHGVYEYQGNTEKFERAKKTALKIYQDSLAPKKSQRWIRFPASYDFQADPGKANKYDPALVEAAITRSKTIMEASGLLSKAIAQAKARGAAFERWETPGKKPPKSVQQMSEAAEAPFDAVEVYSQRACFAIYVSRGEYSGFESTRKDVKADLGSARLFPDEAMASRYAKSRGYDSKICAIVAVDIAPAGFKPMVKGESFPELQAVIAAKEALEIEGAIKSAKIEALEAELAARKAAAEADSGAPPKPPRSRL